jgi:ABC-2 type transport system permease protein
MHQALAWIRRGLITSFAHRTELFLWVLLSIMPIGVMVLVWTNIFGNESHRGITLTHLLWYFFLVVIIRSATGSHFESWRVDEIQTGRIDLYLLKPVSYLKQIFYSDLGGKIQYLALSLPTYLLFSFFIWQSLNLSIPPVSVNQIGLFILMIGYAYLVEFCFALMTVLAAFWFEGADGLEHFKWITISLFSGSTLPVVLMPIWLQELTSKLPFKYMYHVPINVILNNQTLSLIDVVYMFTFLLGLVVTTKIIWHFARIKYAGYGG